MRNLILCLVATLAFAGCATDAATDTTVDDLSTEEVDQAVNAGFCFAVVDRVRDRQCLGINVGANCTASRPGEPRRIGVCQSAGQLPPVDDPFLPGGPRFVCFCKDGPLTAD